MAALTATLTLSAPAWAQLKINDAMEMAVRSHPSISAKKNELRGSGEKLEASRWQRYPSVTVQTTAGQAATGPLYSVRVDQPLWAGGRIDADIKSSEARLQSATAQQSETEQTILIKTASAFTEMIRLQLRIDAADRNVKELTRLLEMIKRRAASEITPQGDVIMARARLQQANSEYLQFKNMAANARADLEQVISQRVGDIVAPDDSRLISTDLGELLRRAEDYSPALQRLKFDIDAANADIDSRKAVIWPQLSARYEHLIGTPYASNSTYLALTFQPGAGLSAMSSVQESLARRAAAENSLESSKKDLLDKVRTDWNQNQSALAEAAVLRELVAATELMYESFIRQYPVGRKSWLEVLNAQREVTQARYSLADTSWNGYLAGIRIDIMTGAISAANKMSLNTNTEK